MRIDGLENGINDNARQRAIVFHSSYSPWSDGCFMTVPAINKEIIKMTEGGAFIYAHKSKKQD